MKFMRKTVAVVLTIALLLTSVCASVSAKEVVLPQEHQEDTELTPEKVNEMIANGEAEVSFEARELSDFTQEEIDADEGLQQLVEDIARDEAMAMKTGARAISNGSADGKVYTLTVDVDMDVVKCFSMPKTKIMAVDVGNSGSSDINTKMYVYEYVTVNGVRKDSWLHYITFSNIEVAMGCGKNTRFTSSARVSGDDYGSSASIDFTALFSVVTNVAGYSTLSALLSALNTVNFSGSNYRTSQNITGSTARVIGAKWKSSVDLIENNAYLLLRSSMSAVTNTTTTSTANAAAQWTFDVYAGWPNLSLLASNVILKPTTTYSVTP